MPVDPSAIPGRQRRRLDGAPAAKPAARPVERALKNNARSVDGPAAPRHHTVTLELTIFRPRTWRAADDETAGRVSYHPRRHDQLAR